MRTSLSSILVVLILISCGLAYALFTTMPGDADVEAKITELSNGQLLVPVKTNILESEEAKTFTKLKVFGSRPIDPAPESLSRSNPFDGI